MAFYGGTDNPNAANAGSTTGSSAYVIPEGSFYPSSITACQNSSYTGGSGLYYADVNDPGAAGSAPSGVSKYPLDGYAFFAADIESLTEALKAALGIIRESTQSSTQASVQLTRTQDENYLYEASFEPILNDPFWHGHLKKYAINPDGTIGAMVTDGDAGPLLKVRNAPG